MEKRKKNDYNQSVLTKEQKQEVVSLAKSLVGVPYIYGTSPDKAPAEFDCSSFIQYIFRHVGIDLPRSTILQAADNQGVEVDFSEDISKLEPGDLLFMRGNQGYYNDNFFPNREMYIGHIAIYIGNGETIHARESVGHVMAQPLNELIAIPKFNIVLVKRY